ncbi:hypothetical protein GH714_030641 [Hevea brasiliensis]|uniref:Uncharacterized protein n=1 Tax=Hevea brasiliensis TaxID=3981 RepID=A0A6A6K7S2_HEVBR|nr:hypothetical protein GH714_030641 [Hevea brasiliensis]
MKVINASHMKYMGDSMRPDWYYPFTYYGQYDYSMIMYNKGLELEYRKIPYILNAIDVSYNKFEGEIPDIIWNLQGLYLLNLSNNFLNGHIPSSLANLKTLECLDLSRNMLLRKLRPELTTLTSLSSFNVSYNQLEGPIPRGNQFDTFESNQYEGNRGLCGVPLKKCENFEASPQERSNIVEDDGAGSIFNENFWKWMIVLMGYGSGLIFGLVIGHKVTRKKHDCISVTAAASSLLLDTDAALNSKPFSQIFKSGLLQTFGPEFREITAAIIARETSITFEELHDKLTDYDAFLERESYTDGLSVTANYTGRNNQSKISLIIKSMIQCQLCDRYGHSAKTCFKGKPGSNSNLMANVSTASPMNNSQQWLMDSAASITSQAI